MIDLLEKIARESLALELALLPGTKVWTAAEMRSMRKMAMKLRGLTQQAIDEYLIAQQERLDL